MSKPLSKQKERELLELHIPHRLCLLVTFRNRSRWFYDHMEKGDHCCDLLRSSKDSALISIRFFSNFLGLSLKRDGQTQQKNLRFRDAKTPKAHPTDLFVNDLGGKLLEEKQLDGAQGQLLLGLLSRADVELAHFTTSYLNHDDCNSAKALIEGTDLIEKLLRQNLYEERGEPFPSLRNESKIHPTGWNFPWIPLDGPSPFLKD